jgi:hypothetical protein
LLGVRGLGRHEQERNKMATVAAVTTARIGVAGYANRARWATVRVETEGGVYVGRVYVPETKKRLSDVLCDDRPFLNMTEVTINGGDQPEPFVAVNKNFIRNVRVVLEEEAETGPRVR